MSSRRRLRKARGYTRGATPSLALTASLARLSDLNDDGDNKLIIADMNKKLKIYKGTNVIFTETLSDMPVAVETFYDSTSKPTIPFIAIAAGSSIYYYHKYRAHFKYDLPEVELSPEELQVWSKLKNNLVSVADAMEELNTIRETKELSSQSNEALALETHEEQEAFVRERKDKPIRQVNYVTCMSRMQKNLDDEKAVTMLVVGTEQRHLIIMEHVVGKIKKTVRMPSVPVFLDITGQFDIDYKAYVACRDGKVYVVKNSEVGQLSYDIETKPVGLVRIDKTIVVGGMNNTFYSFFAKGKKNFSVFLPAAITNMDKLEITRTQNVRAVLVAIANGEVRLYNDMYLITTIKCDDIVTGMAFGVFGREEGSLVLNFKSGGLTVKILQR